MKHTALYDKHISLNAKMVPFAGYSMPMSYSSIIDEHNAVRNMIGVFDVSHMGEFKISGEGAENFLQLLTTNDVKKISVGQAQYSAICLKNGGIVDDIILCSKKGLPMKREKDIIDVWFESGSMPYAQTHYPFENKDLIDGKSNFPADFIAEGVDQTRGWFYTLHAISTIVFDSISYKNVVSNGLVLDKNGQKMSSSYHSSTLCFSSETMRAIC